MTERQFVSYPKSGRTWIRYILTQLELDENIKFHHDNFEFNDGAKPAHDFDVNARLQRYKAVDKLVYLERDPRDVMVSLYHQVTGRFKDFFAYEGTLSDFIRDDYFGAENLKRYRNMWNTLTKRLGFLKVTYEMCHEDTVGTIQKIVDYYGFEVSADKIREAVEEGRFDKMKTVEASGSFKEPWLRPRNDSPKVRRGKVGGFRDTLSEADIQYLNQVFELENFAPATTGFAGLVNSLKETFVK